MGNNGKIRPGYAMYKGEPTLLVQGRYQLRQYKGTKNVFTDVGEDPQAALIAFKTESFVAVARGTALSAGIEVVEKDTKRIVLTKKKTEFIDRHLAKGQQRASETSLQAIDDFLLATGLIYADQVTEERVLDFYRALRKKGNKDRTIYNKHMSLFGFFKWLKLDTKALAEKPPDYTEREVQTYRGDELADLLDHVEGYQRVVWELFMKTGMRELEAVYLEWSNVDFLGKKIKVRETLDNEEYSNTIKDRAERSIPLDDELALTLEAWKKERAGTRLVIGTRNDTPNNKLLRTLKRTVNNAELNCGACAGCRGTKECRHWTLKKFRSTYTTTLLRNGVDARTVMEYTGHEDLATVLKYLAPADDAVTQKKISAISWTKKR
jgi:integrase